MKPFRTIIFGFLLALWVSAASATELIHFDLGQDGAATLVVQEMPDGRRFHVLIDTGHSSARADRGAGKVRAALNRLGIKHLDAVVITHIDSDHGGGLTSLNEEVPQGISRDGKVRVDARGPPIGIGQVIWPGIVRQGEGPDKSFKAFWASALENAASLKIPFYTPETGASDQLRQFGIDVRRMSRDKAVTSNDTSLILTVSDPRNGTNYLLTGDMTQRSLAELQTTLPASVEILHAPHHGADRVLFKLLQLTKPRYVVVSADKNNMHRHPPIRILRELARQGHREDLREKERQRQAAKELILRAELIDYLVTFTIDPDFPTGSSPYRKSNSGDPVPDGLRGMKRAVLTEDQLAVNNAHARLRDLTPKDIKQDVLRTVPSRSGIAPLSYGQLLITGELGDVSFLDGKLTSALPVAAELFLREMAWYELRYLTDREIDRLANRETDSRERWLEIQGLLAARTAERFQVIQTSLKAAPTERPLWLTDVEAIVSRLKGWTRYTGVQMDAALAEWCQPERAWGLAEARRPKDARIQLRAPQVTGDEAERRERTERDVLEPLRIRAERRLGKKAYGWDVDQLVWVSEAISGIPGRFTPEQAREARSGFSERHGVDLETGRRGVGKPKPGNYAPKEISKRPPIRVK